MLTQIQYVGEKQNKKNQQVLSSHLKIASVNIEGNCHLERVIPFLKKQNVDIICLQEVFSNNLIFFEQQLEKKSYFCANAKLTEPNGFRFEPLGEWGTAILTNLPVLERGQHYYFGKSQYIPELIPYNSDSRCKALQFVNVVYENIVFTVATTHFTWSPNGKPDLKQWRDLKQLLPILKDLKSFTLLGDFNAPRGTAVFSELSKYYQDNIPSSIKSTIDGTLHRSGPINLVVDGIFTTSDYYASNVEVHTGVSDHCALIANIQRQLSY